MSERRAGSQAGPFYTVFVDDREFRIEQSRITGGELMDLAGLPREVGLLLIEDDGTRVRSPLRR